MIGTDTAYVRTVTTFSRVFDEDGNYTGRRYGHRPGRGNQRRRAISDSLRGAR